MSCNKVSVVGLGYIGLPTAAVLASKGYDVLGVDTNKHAVDTINNGLTHIYEPDLDNVVKSVVENRKLRASQIPEEADVFLLAVPTPFKGENKKPDLKYVQSATNSIAPVLKKGDLVILESTSPVGTTESVAKWITESRPDLVAEGERLVIDIAYCPERVMPGNLLKELIENSRVVGGLSKSSARRAAEFYRTFVSGECIETNARTAELCKLTENSFRDVNIAFANELSMICDDLGVDVWELISLANKHPRVNILQPGTGVGGHCIAVDPWFIVDSAPERSKLIKLAREVNDSKPEWVVSKVASQLNIVKSDLADEKEVTIALYGLAFKPNIDDLRESPALQVATTISNSLSASILYVEPNIKELPESIRRGDLVSSEEAFHRADIHVLLVDHKDFYDSKPNNGVIIDFRGIW